LGFDNYFSLAWILRSVQLAGVERRKVVPKLLATIVETTAYPAPTRQNKPKASAEEQTPMIALAVHELVGLASPAKSSGDGDKTIATRIRITEVLNFPPQLSHHQTPKVEVSVAKGDRSARPLWGRASAIARRREEFCFTDGY
jgi:hypothetical protein